MKATLSLIRTKHEVVPLRTKMVTGILISKPVVGESVCLFSDSLTGSHQLRQVRTSPVVAIKETATGCTFETLNSVYDLQYHDNSTFQN